MVTVRDAIGDLPNLSGSDGSGGANGSSGSGGSSGANIANHVAIAHSDLNILRFSYIPRGCVAADWRDLPDQLIPWCLTNTSDSHTDWKECFGRLNWDWRWPTCITTKPSIFKACVLHPEEDRVYSVREGARAMGFPDTFEFMGSIRAQYRQNGNAVPPPMAKAIGKEIVIAFEQLPVDDNLNWSEEDSSEEEVLTKRILSESHKTESDRRNKSQKI